MAAGGCRTAPPAESWLHLETSNPIESVLSGVGLRANVAKRARVREDATVTVIRQDAIG